MAGLDPFEERLLIALLGGGVALIFALVLGVICCRKYRLDRSGGKERKWNQQQLMYQQPGRPAYYPTGHQTNVNMDPSYLDPSRAGYLPGAAPNLNPTYASAGAPHHQQQQPPAGLRPMPNVDNTAYASVPSPYGRPAQAISYPSHQV